MNLAQAAEAEGGSERRSAPVAEKGACVNGENRRLIKPVEMLAEVSRDEVREGDDTPTGA